MLCDASRFARRSTHVDTSPLIAHVRYIVHVCIPPGGYICIPALNFWADINSNMCLILLYVRLPLLGLPLQNRVMTAGRNATVGRLAVVACCFNCDFGESQSTSLQHAHSVAIIAIAQGKQEFCIFIHMHFRWIFRLGHNGLN
jgi:hypothetical protein